MRQAPRSIGVVLTAPVQTHKTTIVKGRVSDSTGDAFEIHGESRKVNEDRFNSDIGVLYATARALEAAARKIRRRADGLVRNDEHIKAQRVKIAEGKNKPKETLTDKIVAGNKRRKRKSAIKKVKRAVLAGS